MYIVHMYSAPCMILCLRQPVLKLCRVFLFVDMSFPPFWIRFYNTDFFTPVIRTDAATIAFQLLTRLPDGQMAYFQTKIPNLGTFWRVLQRYWYILCPFGIFYVHLVYFTTLWYFLFPFGLFGPFWYVEQRRFQPLRFDRRQRKRDHSVVNGCSNR
jgi:hypothetical protein